MKIVTPAQMNSIDKNTINNYGIPGLLLMENAAAAVALEAVSMLGGSIGGVITAVAGRGNNGGDAFAAARLLHGKGFDVCVFLAGAKAGISGDALTNMVILEKIGINIVEINGAEEIALLDSKLKESQLVIDGVFGTGLSRDISGIASTVIESMNLSGKPILSIDIPSGIDGADGSICGTCIRADATVTFCMPKIGLVVNPGCEYAGRLKVADIGIPRCVIDTQVIRCEIIDAGMAAGMIPQRRPDSNKGTYGKAFIISGSTGMTGSGRLACTAALRAGAGLVYAGVPESLAGIYSTSLTEPVIIALPDGGKGYLSEESESKIKERMAGMDVVAIGPGLSAAEGVKRLVEMVITECKVPLVLDADALNVISGNTEILKRLGTEAVITPHPGEMARLTGLTAADVQKDRIGTAGRFASEYGVVTVLKGSRTIIALPDGRIFINPTGNAGMATAGTGDVLAGVITGLIAQGVSAGEAAIAGVYLHGLAGDLAADSMGMHGILAGDVARHLPYAIKEMIKLRRPV